MSPTRRPARRRITLPTLSTQVAALIFCGGLVLLIGASALLALQLTMGLAVTLIIVATAAMAAGGTLPASRRERRRGAGFSAGGAAMSCIGAVFGPFGLGIVLMLTGGFFMGRPLLKRALSH